MQPRMTARIRKWRHRVFVGMFVMYGGVTFYKRWMNSSLTVIFGANFTMTTFLDPSSVEYKITKSGDTSHFFYNHFWSRMLDSYSPWCVINHIHTRRTYPSTEYNSPMFHLTLITQTRMHSKGGTPFTFIIANESHPPSAKHFRYQ